MKKLLLLLLCVPLIGVGQTQMEMNLSAAKKYSDTDSSLNSLYEKLISEYSKDTLFIKNLKKSQELWNQIKNTHYLLKYHKNVDIRQGSFFPVCEYTFLTEITQQRIDFLMPWYVGDPGGSDGDICSGSIKIVW